MLHTCLHTICFVFCYTSWHFYAFSGTNLLTRCHSASSPFSAIFVFQKSYTGNILGIGRNKSRTTYFYRSFTKTEDETEGGQGPAIPCGGAAQPLATPPGGEATWATSWRCPFAYKFPSTGKTWGTDRFSSKHTASRRHRRREIGRIQELFPAPCRRGESLPPPPPWSPPEWCVSSLPWTTGP
jgi:hypothetical protein